MFPAKVGKRVALSPSQGRIVELKKDPALPIAFAQVASKRRKHPARGERDTRQHQQGEKSLNKT